jgi:hypothetical protein
MRFAWKIKIRVAGIIFGRNEQATTRFTSNSSSVTRFTYYMIAGAEKKVTFMKDKETAQTERLIKQTQGTMRDITDLVLSNGEPAVIVQSPPGGGKTELAIILTIFAVVYYKLRVAVVTPKIEQAVELAYRLATHFSTLPIQILLPRNHEFPPKLAAPKANVGLVYRAKALIPGPGVIVGTVAKFCYESLEFTPKEFGLVVADEIWQMDHKFFEPLFELGRQFVLLGDPGQLLFWSNMQHESIGDTRYKLILPISTEVMSQFPNAPVKKLPASLRLVEDTTKILQPAFYPKLPFNSAVINSQRQLRFSQTGLPTNPLDKVLDLVAEGASLVGILLPSDEATVLGIDQEVAKVMAGLAKRVLARGAEWVGNRMLTPSDIAYIDANATGGFAIRSSLFKNGILPDQLICNTPEILQGTEFPLTIVHHPLSGPVKLDEFSANMGRFCVMLSRHLLGCIIVGREDIGEGLNNYQPNSLYQEMGSLNFEWSGWKAHRHIWSELERLGRLVRV